MFCAQFYGREFSAPFLVTLLTCTIKRHRPESSLLFIDAKGDTIINRFELGQKLSDTTESFINIADILRAHDRLNQHIQGFFRLPLL